MSSGPRPEIDAARFERLFAAVAEIGRGPGGWTRPPWSDELRRAEAVVAEAAAESGLGARHDAAGNLWLEDPGCPPSGIVATGSHLDTVPQGGAYDGALGVVSGLVAVEALRRAAVAGAERLTVVSFADEEGWRFGTPLFGSRARAGRYGPDVLERRDADGVLLRDVAPSDPFAEVGFARLDAFVEVHVEQGLALAPAGAAIGIATGLAARARLAFTVEGQANHAGTTPMTGRRDALVAAAGLILAVRDAALAVPQAVATVGRVDVEPGGSNVIPGRVRGVLDVRAPTPAARDAVLASIRGAFPDVAFAALADDPGCRFDLELVAAAESAADARGVSRLRLPSYAGHDAGVLAAAGVPAVMLFVRSPNGVSHDPSERASSADCVAACAVLADVLADRLTR